MMFCLEVDFTRMLSCHSKTLSCCFLEIHEHRIAPKMSANSNILYYSFNDIESERELILYSIRIVTFHDFSFLWGIRDICSLLDSEKCVIMKFSNYSKTIIIQQIVLQKYSTLKNVMIPCNFNHFPIINYRQY